jgi:hypothetical protein
MTQTSNLSDNNLNCETILRKRNRWLSKKNEFNFEEEFKKVLNSNQNNKSFLYSIIHDLDNPLKNSLE